jgi:hypothetical protein
LAEASSTAQLTGENAITFSSDLAEEVSVIVEDLDAVGPVVGDEDLLPGSKTSLSTQLIQNFYG